jgi:DNA (cytosine-5)-methyltransferase 1
MDYTKKTRGELIDLCKSREIKGYSGKKKAELVSLLSVDTITHAPSSVCSNALSLFSGAGGDTQGLKKAGWNVTHFSEFNAPATRTHMAVFPDSKLLTGKDGSSNIKEISDETFGALKGKVDLIFAGHPCQGFSHAGKKRADDPRNELVHEFVRAVRLVKPRWIIGENVKGLLSRKGVYPAKTPPRPVIEIIRDLFEAEGYKITYRAINTTEVGVPQLRNRLLYVGHRGDLYPHLPWERLPTPAVKPTIRALLTSTLEGAMEYPARFSPASADARFWIPTTGTAPTGTPHPNLVRLMGGIRNLSAKEKEELGHTGKGGIQHVEPAGLISFGVRKSQYHGQVLDPDGPSKTIICAYTICPRLFVGLRNATTGKYWIRCLTPEECGAIQGFPVDYAWQGSAKDKITQIGNAVPPPLATAIANLLPLATFHRTPQDSKAVLTTESSDDEEE